MCNHVKDGQCIGTKQPGSPPPNPAPMNLQALCRPRNCSVTSTTLAHCNVAADDDEKKVSSLADSHILLKDFQASSSQTVLTNLVALEGREQLKFIHCSHRGAHMTTVPSDHSK